MICKVCRHCGLCEGDGTVRQNSSIVIEQSDSAFDKMMREASPTKVSDDAGNTFSLNDIGIAFDIGTTTIAAAAYTLCDAKKILSCGEENLQIQFGSDVIARISFASTPEGFDALHKTVIIQLNHLVQKIMRDVEASFSSQRKGRASLKKIVIAGNTAMESFAAGVPVNGLAMFPFSAGSTFGYGVKGSVLFNERSAVPADAEIYFAPIVSAFVGGDCVCAMSACGFGNEQNDGRSMILADVGTNCEMCLYDGQTKQIFCTSSAAGPAFEGQGISCGMTATEGAIADVRVEKEIAVRTIGGGEPKGICGTGLMSAIASFYKAGMIDSTGAIANGDEAISIVTDKIQITQRDIRNFQLAKAAVASGIETLLERSESQAENVQLFLAGGFGTALNPDDAKQIGMIPRSLGGSTVGVGNASLAGAALVLLSNQCRDRAERIAKQAQSVDLAQNASFQKRYIDALNF